MQKTHSLFKNMARALGLSFKFVPGITLAIFLITITTSLAPLLQSKILGDVVNHLVDAVNTRLPSSSILMFVLLYSAVWGGIRIFNVLELYISKIWRDKFYQRLDILILKKRTEIDLGHYENPDFQNLLLRAFSQGVGGPFLEVNSHLFAVIGSLAVIIVSSIISVSIGWNIYAIIMVTSIPSFVAQIKYGHKVWGIWNEHSERQKKFGSLRAHILGKIGITQVKLLQNNSRLLTMIEDIHSAFIKDNNKLDRERFLFQTFGAIFASAGFGYSIWLIAKGVIAGELNVGTLVFIIGALGALVGGLNILLARFANLIERNLYLTDIFTILDTKPFIKRPEHPIPLHLTKAPVIEFKNVGFKYEGREDWILKDINFTIASGEKIALVGENGAGKTTLVKLLARIYDPTEGSILVNGIDLKETSPEEWGAYLSVLLQDYINYDLIAKESIGMGRISAPIDISKVESAAKYSGADEFIEGWEKQYEQQIGKEFEGGIEPSKGQSQKLALARTIYRDGLIMILDEPTAAIDALSEMEIFEQMEKSVGDHTLLLITHRFNTTQSVDRIVVLEHGTVEEIGSHSELIKKNGLYKKMFDSQAKAFQEQKSE